MPYWINSMSAPTPALAWVFFGLGLPWALVVLPRREWRDWPTIACLTIAFGGALLTALMFILGSFQGAGLLRLEPVLAGTAILAVIGWVSVWRKKSRVSTPSIDTEKNKNQLALDEKLLIGLIGVALVVRWLGVAYWPSTAYDALWVYAYEGKLYTLLGYIPNTIGYYPQFLPLLETYTQLAVGGVNDHAARAVLPWLHIGSILAAYVLGRRLFNRRVGIYVAAMWALYPHVGEWSRYGDLEIPVTFLFTAAAAFFLLAWTTPSPLPGEGRRSRRQYALIAGLLLGVGMWTKPTMGAFIWGVLLLVGIEVIQRIIGIKSRQQPERGTVIKEVIRASWPRIEVAIWTGAASIPLGAAWYMRNMLAGHQPIDLPPGFWQTLAAQSGAEFGWPLLALLVLIGWIVNHQRSIVSDQKENLTIEIQRETEKTIVVSPLPVGQLILGLALVLAGLVPSIVSPHRMGVIEWVALVVGAGVTLVTLWRWAQGRWMNEGRDAAAKIIWGMALAFPYFVTWFFSYSYHYRLSFAIVPLMILPTAVILAHWTGNFSPENKRTHHQRIFGAIYLVGLVMLAIPGVLSPLYDPNAGWDWLWTNKLPDDHARYESGNVALMSVVDGLQIYRDTHEEPLQVVAPGLKRLPFFFPLEDIRIDEMPTNLSDLDGVTYFIYGVPESGGDFNTFVPGNNPILDVLSIATTDETDTKSILRQAWWNDDGIFKYMVYELHLEKRWEKPDVTIPPEGDVVFGGFLRYLGYDILSHDFWPGRRLVTNFFWEVLEKPTADYVVYIHLVDKDNNLIAAWDAPITRTNDGNYYSSLVWDKGEYIIDRRILTITDSDIPMADDYHIIIGLYDRATETRVPITIDGQPSGDGYTLTQPFARIPGDE